MLIECRQRRDARPNKRVGRKDLDAGSKSKVHGKLYHFRPQPALVNGGDELAHVCEVTDPRAIERYLGIAEAYNEFGKPPRVAKEGTTFATGGQPEIKTVLLDSDDDLGARDSKPFVSDPLEKARQLSAEWVQNMLDKSVHDIVKEVPGLENNEIELLLDGEKAGQQRSELLEALSDDAELGEDTHDIKME